jgi:two-component system nitrogen regulation sensor histidine kinase NtrY
VSTGVISLDARGFFTTINKSAQKMLGLKGDQFLRRSYKKVLKPEHLPLAKDFLEELENSPSNAVQKTIRVVIGQTTRIFMIHITALKDDNDHFIGTVVVFDDLTEIAKAQRMAAWQEVAKRIAHEVKNPLTPIKLSAQRLKRKYAEQIHGDKSVFRQCTETIIDQVDLIGNLVSEFSAFARLPAVNPAPCDLPDIVEEAVAPYREAHPHIFFEVEMDRGIPQLNVDRRQIKRVLLNLIANAIAAIDGDGQITVTLTFDPVLKSAQLEVSDTGTGIPPEDKGRLFDPDFSTKKTGMGLGLAIVNAIVEDHSGSIQVQDNHPTGTRFIVQLPA